MDDICGSYHKGNTESREAHVSIERMKEAMRAKIAGRLKEVPAGRTCDEIETDLCLRHQTASARISELLASGRIIRTKMRRATRSGRNASVVVAPEHWTPECGIAGPRRARAKEDSHGRS
jgi:predicted transcriptional regulator